jgi:hypothetical protein
MRGNIDRSFEIKCVSLKYPWVQSDDSLKNSILSVERDFVSKYIQSVDNFNSTVLFPILKNTPNSLFYKVLDFYDECERARRNAVIYGDSFIYILPNRGHCKVICYDN